MKKYQAKALVLGIGVAVSGAAYPFSGTSMYGSGGGGSLVAQNTGMDDYGFTKDVMCFPNGEFYNSPTVGLGYTSYEDFPYYVQFTPAVTFQVNVDSPSCNYIGIAEEDIDGYPHYYSSYKGMHSWNTGEVMGEESSASTTASWETPYSWVEIIYLPYSESSRQITIDRPFAVAAACGETAEDAMSKARTVANLNVEACD